MHQHNNTAPDPWEGGAGPGRGDQGASGSIAATLRRLVEDGIPVLPCEPGGKAPLASLAPHGLHDATTDWGTVRRWLAAAPGANWAARTGPLVTGPWAGRHLSGLDIDDPKVAEAVLAKTAVRQLTTFTRTPAEGLHVYALSARAVYSGPVLASDGRHIGDIKGTAAAGGPGGYLLVLGQVGGRPYDLHLGAGPILVEDGLAWFTELLRAAGVEIDVQARASAPPVGCGSALSRVLARLEERGCRPVGRNGSWSAFCPGHDDGRRRGLSIRQAEDGRVLIYCHHGYQTEDILAALGMGWRDLFPDPDGRGNGHQHSDRPFRGKAPSGGGATPQGEFDSLERAKAFVEEAGTCWDEAQALGVRWDSGLNAVAFTWPTTKVRKLRLRREGDGKWAWADHEGERKPSLWPDVTLGDLGLAVICEGERDALALRALGLPAFSVTAGAGSPPRQEDIARLLALGVRRFLLSYDADQAGADGESKARGAIYATARRWGLRVQVESLPLPLEAVAQGAKDWTEAVGLLGKEALTEAVRHPSPSSLYMTNDDGRMRPAPLAAGGGGAPAWLVGGLLPEGFPSNLYGDSGQGKSWLALYLAVQVAREGGSFLGLPTRNGPVLYLDWELSREVHSERLARLLKGLGLSEGPSRLYYVRLDAALDDCFEDVAAWIGELRPSLVIIDSYQAAAGDDPLKPQVVSRFYQRLRQLGVTVLVVDHQARAGEMEYAARYEFGSSYKRHMARSSLQLEAVGQEGGRLGLVLRHQKSSFARRLKDINLVLEFHDEAEGRPVALRLATEGERQDEKLFGRYGLVLGKLSRLGQATAEQLAEGTGLDVRVVRNTLTALKKQGWVRVVGRGGESGKAAVYAPATPDSSVTDSSYSDDVTDVTDDERALSPLGVTPEMLSAAGFESEDDLSPDEEEGLADVSDL